MRPDVGRYRPSSRCAKVDFPDPDWPTMPMGWPGWISSEMWLTTAGPSVP